jgi:hypothetical protein
MPHPETATGVTATDAATDTTASTETAHEQPFPFTRPVGSDANMFIQWKGTVVCLDFHCSCGTHGHYDGDFAYSLHCPACGAVYEMGTQVIAKRTDDTHHVEHAKTLDIDPFGSND